MDKNLIIFIQDRESHHFYKIVQDDLILPISLKDESVGYCRIAFLLDGQYFIELMDVQRIYLINGDQTCAKFQIIGEKDSKLNQCQQKLSSIHQHNFIKDVCIPLIMEYNGKYEPIL